MEYSNAPRARVVMAAARLIVLSGFASAATFAEIVPNAAPTSEGAAVTRVGAKGSRHIRRWFSDKPRAS